MHSTPDNDLRKKEFFADDKGIIKFDCDFPWSYIRFILCSGAEMKLIAAEAEARQGHDDAALKELKEFAATRYTNYVEPARANLLQSILDERRKEFCFEPFYSLVRHASYRSGNEQKTSQQTRRTRGL